MVRENAESEHWTRNNARLLLQTTGEERKLSHIGACLNVSERGRR
jgi:hypothetical protein